jgi:hypothetical protein
MSKTPFSNKCEILGSLWLNYREEARTNEAWESFFEYNDIGLPLAYFISDALVSPTDEDATFLLIDETWEMFCKYIDIDPEDMYEDIAEAFGASKNPPLENDE